MNVAYTVCDLCEAPYSPDPRADWVVSLATRHTLRKPIDVCTSCEAALGRDPETLWDLCRTVLIEGLRADIRHGIGPDEGSS